MLYTYVYMLYIYTAPNTNPKEPDPDHPVFQRRVNKPPHPERRKGGCLRVAREKEADGFFCM